MAETDPEDVPAVAVGRVSIGICGVSEEVAAAMGEFVELGFYSQVPIGVIFKNEGRRVALFYYCSYSVHMRPPGSEGIIWHFPMFLSHWQSLGGNRLSTDPIYVFHAEVRK